MMAAAKSQAIPPGCIVQLATGAQREYLQRFGTYTFTVQREDRRWASGAVALLLDDEDITEIGSVSSAAGGATGERHLRYERRFEIAPLAAREIEWELPKPQLRAAFEDRVAWGGRFSPKTWTAVIHAFRQLRVEYVSALDALFDEIAGRTTGLSGQALQVAAHERDAVGLALDFADFDRRLLRDALPDGQGSFVQRLGEVRAMEDPVIAFDALRFLDFKAIDSPAGIVRLRQGDEELVVVNANRQKLETTLGADLIYLNEQRRSLVFVQYKTMRDKLGGEPVFRGDDNLDRELEAMRAVELGDDDGSPAAFRLSKDFGFIKLCAPVTDIRRHRTGPMAGLYLPLGYFDVVRASSQVGRGPQGGLALNWRTAGRYLTNTQFAELVRGGWIGTRGASTETLTDRMVHILNGDRSATLAVKRSSGSKPMPARRRRPTRP